MFIAELKPLMQSIDRRIDVLLARLVEQENEINDLKKSHDTAARQIEQYVTELEQIRNYYVNSKNNIK